MLSAEDYQGKADAQKGFGDAAAQKQHSTLQPGSFNPAVNPTPTICTRWAGSSSIWAQAHGRPKILRHSRLGGADNFAVRRRVRHQRRQGCPGVRPAIPRGHRRPPGSEPKKQAAATPTPPALPAAATSPSYWQLHCPSPTDAFDKNVRSSSAHVVPAASPDARRAGACECAIRVVHKPPQPPAHARRRLRSMPAGASHQPRRRGHRSTPDRPSYT